MAEYTYEDIITAKDILTGKVKKEDIIGKRGWLLDFIPKDMNMDEIEREGLHGRLREIDLDCASPFRDDCLPFTYFLPEKEESTEKTEKKSYEERQAKWVKDNNVKVGDRVRILRKAEDHEDGWGDVWTVGCSVGCGEIVDINNKYGIRVCMDDTPWTSWYPYFVLEKVEDEPEYVPFDLSREEDRQFLRDKWIRSKQTGNEARIVCFKHTREHDWQAHIPQTGLRSGFELLHNYEFLDGSPIGKPANGQQIRRNHDA